MEIIDRKAIDRRFLEYFEGESPTEIAQYFDVTPPTVFQWVSGHSHVPWNKLKYVVDEMGVSWDWLIEGKKPKNHKGDWIVWNPKFEWEAINQRFLLLFPGLSQVAIAELLEVTRSTVSAWNKNRWHVPWDKMKWAVDNKKATWEWLLEGR